MEKEFKKQPTINSGRGKLLALLVIPLGIAAWLFLWQFGFIASVVAWGIAWGAVWLYTKGSGQEVTRAVAPYIIGVIILGVVLAFLSGMISDLWYAYTTEMNGTQSFFSAEFMGMAWENLIWWDFVSSYMIDMLISLAFAALGAGGIIYGLYKSDATDSKESKKDTKSEA